MNIIVIGLGSMGKRRIRLLLNNFKDVNVIGVDTSEERRQASNELYNIEAYDSIDIALNNHQIDCAFICTSPLSHNQIISKCLSYNLHVFTELNLVQDGYDDNIALAKEKNKILFLSSTPLYRKEMKYIIDIIHQKPEEINYTYHVGQYLPDWHPWETINDFFVSNPKTNGCREILAIELPWMIKAFGKIRDIKVISSKMSNLDINYNDNYMILLQHEDNRKGVFIVDIVSREAKRQFTAYSETITIEWEGKPDSLRIKDSNKENQWETIALYEQVDKLNQYSSNIIENQYLDEIREFLDILAGKKTINYGFNEDKYTLDLIDYIERQS